MFGINHAQPYQFKNKYVISGALFAPIWIPTSFCVIKLHILIFLYSVQVRHLYESYFLSRPFACWDLHMFYLLRPILFRTCRHFSPDYALRISLGTFSILLVCKNSALSEVQMYVLESLMTRNNTFVATVISQIAKKRKSFVCFQHAKRNQTFYLIRYSLWSYMLKANTGLLRLFAFCPIQIYSDM